MEIFPECSPSARPAAISCSCTAPAPDTVPGRVCRLRAHVLIGPLSPRETTGGPSQHLQLAGRECGAGIHQRCPQSSQGGNSQRAEGETEAGLASPPPCNYIKSMDYSSPSGRSGDAPGCQPPPTVEWGYRRTQLLCQIIPLKHRIPVHFGD